MLQDVTVENTFLAAAATRKPTKKRDVNCHVYNIVRDKRQTGCVQEVHWTIRGRHTPLHTNRTDINSVIFCFVLKPAFLFELQFQDQFQ